MATGRRRFRAYHHVGLYKKRLTPTQLQAAATLNQQLVADHLDGDPTSGQAVILALIGAAAARHKDAWDYLQTLPKPWIDKRSRRAWKLTHDLSLLEKHVSKLVLNLCDPALARKPPPVKTIEQYASEQEAEAVKAETLKQDGVFDDDDIRPSPGTLEIGEGEEEEPHS